MTYLEHGMWEILDVLKRIHDGQNFSSISRSTGRSRKTIRQYDAIAKDLGWVPELHAPDEHLAAEVLAKNRPGPKPTKTKPEQILEPHADQIKQWLKPQDGYKRGLRLTKIHTLLKRKNILVSYSELYRFARKHLGFRRHAGETVRVADVQPGELAEVDFGRLGLVFDPDKSCRRFLYALIVTLVFSRHQYVYVTHRQTLDALIAGIEEAWEFFGGVSARVVIDNLKAAVKKADRYEPIFQRTFNEYATYRGFEIDAAIPNHAKGKPHVERQVPYVREDFFRGEEWLNRDHVQREAIRWCISTAGTRIHGTTRQQPLVQFEHFEKWALKSLLRKRFDTPEWAEPKVHPDFHIRFQNALYSVPHEYEGMMTRGQQVTVRGDRSLVRIYLRGTLIKTHVSKPAGCRSTDYGDYPPEKTPYAMRDANYLIRVASQRGEFLGKFTARLLEGNFPWSHLRQTQKLLRLADKYGDERLNAACRRALSFDLINVRRVEGIVLKSLADKAVMGGSSESIAGEVIQLPFRFLRPGLEFNHQKKKEKEENGNQTIS